MVQSPKLSIIIISYNRKEICENLIRLLNDQIKDRITYEIIVLNNGSKEPYKFRIKNSKCVRMKTNILVPEARNIALNKITGRYILMLDDDIKIYWSSVRNLLIYIEKHPNVDMVFPEKIDIYKDGRERYYSFFKPTLFGNLKKVDCWVDGEGVDFGGMVYMTKPGIAQYDVHFGMNQFKERGYAVREESAMQAKVKNKRAVPGAVVYHYVNHYQGGAKKDKTKIAYWTGYGNALFIKRYLTFGKVRSLLWVCTYGVGHFILNSFNFSLFKGWWHGYTR